MEAGVAELHAIGSYDIGRYNPTIIESRQRLTGIDEANDIHALYAPDLKPDLIIESIGWSPETPSKGDIVTISVTVKNQGSDKALPSRVSFYVDGSFKTFKDVQSMEAGATVTKDFTWTAEQGSHVIKMIIDEENWIPESEETNNEKSITISTLTPDLIIESLAWSPEDPSEGDNVTFTVTIKNQGEGKADYSLVFPYVDDARLDSASVGTINPGTVDTTTFSWIAQAGSHIISLVIDPNNAVLESNESNNEKVVDFPGLFPDLFIQSITWSPANPSVGETVTFSVTIKNQGRAVISSSRFSFYIGGVTSGSQSIQRIAVGESATETFTWAAKAAPQIVWVIIDPDNNVTESDESNNEKMVTFSGAKAADLFIQSITWSPANPSVGETMTFTVIVKNKGSGEAASSYVAYYIDDNYLASDSVGPMGSGDTLNQTFTWTVQEGSHTIKVVADSKTKISESDEGNNEKAVVYPVPPDLVIEMIVLSPPYPSESDNVTFIVTIKNQGDSRVDKFEIAYYIDDIYLVYITAGAVDPGATANSTFVWTAEAGTHTIKAVVDPYDKLLEISENNNEKAIPFLAHEVSSTTTSSSSTISDTEVEETLLEMSEPIDTSDRQSQASLWLFALLGIGAILLAVSLFLEYKRRHS